MDLVFLEGLTVFDSGLASSVSASAVEPSSVSQPHARPADWQSRAGPSQSTNPELGENCKEKLPKNMVDPFSSPLSVLEPSALSLSHLAHLQAEFILLTQKPKISQFGDSSHIGSIARC